MPGRNSLKTTAYFLVPGLRITSNYFHPTSVTMGLYFVTPKFSITCTVKPVVTTTSEQRPPANNDRPESGPTKFRAEFPSE
jgi:hypothetical protein